MKITTISKLFCAFVLCVSLMSFRNSDQTEGKDDTSVKAATMQASIFQTGSKGYKVKLAVDKGTDQNLRIYLKDKGGKIYYREFFSRKEDKYRRIFDLADMTDGTYYFELYYNNQKLTKEIQLETKTERAILFQ